MPSDEWEARPDRGPAVLMKLGCKPLSHAISMMHIAKSTRLLAP